MSEEDPDIAIIKARKMKALKEQAACNRKVKNKTTTARINPAAKKNR